MIIRIWHGWTTPYNADRYEALLEEEVEFVTIMTFESLEAVRAFAGEDYETAVVSTKARVLLSHFDERSQHDEVRIERSGVVE
jgi:hypothetical protein